MTTNTLKVERNSDGLSWTGSITQLNGQREIIGTISYPQVFSMDMLSNFVEYFGENNMTQCDALIGAAASLSSPIYTYANGVKDFGGFGVASARPCIRSTTVETSERKEFFIAQGQWTVTTPEHWTVSLKPTALASGTYLTSPICWTSDVKSWVEFLDTDGTWKTHATGFVNDTLCYAVGPLYKSWAAISLPDNTIIRWKHQLGTRWTQYSEALVWRKGAPNTPGTARPFLASREDGTYLTSPTCWTSDVKSWVEFKDTDGTWKTHATGFVNDTLCYASGQALYKSWAAISLPDNTIIRWKHQLGISPPQYSEALVWQRGAPNTPGRATPEWLVTRNQRANPTAKCRSQKTGRVRAFESKTGTCPTGWKKLKN
jgi:hypothetical protein